MSIDMQKIKWPGWETIRLIGRGSFGAVYEIQRDVLGDIEKAALKVISIPQNASDIDEMYSDGYDDESITSTFKSHLKSIIAEYSLMRKMSDCVNIVRCDDVRYEQHEDGIGWDIFIKMELLTSLTKALPEKIPEQAVIKLGKDMCNALEQCKKNNIVHRDIKPQNIFVSDNGDYKLGDFGIAKTVEKTMGGTKIGTYKYMAPEVYNNQPYGTAADIYSLGLVLYWMLNERRMPFLPLPPQNILAGMDEEARSRRFSGEAIPAPAHGSAQLKRVVLKACAFDPADRYSSPAQMLADLENAANGGAHRAQQSFTSSRSSNTGTGTSPKANPVSKALDLNAVLTISNQEAAQGCKKTIQLATTGNTIAVQVPAGIKNGQVLRLRDLGKTDPATGARGTLYLQIKINQGTADFQGNQASSTTTVIVTTEEARKGVNIWLKSDILKDRTWHIPAGVTDGQTVIATSDGMKTRVKVKVLDEQQSKLAVYKVFPSMKWEEMPASLLSEYRNKKSMNFIAIFFLELLLCCCCSGLGLVFPPAGFLCLLLMVWCIVKPIKVSSNRKKAQAEWEKRKIF